jgi:hypothetical protein
MSGLHSRRGARCDLTTSFGPTAAKYFLGDTLLKPLVIQAFVVKIKQNANALLWSFYGLQHFLNTTRPLEALPSRDVLQYRHLKSRIVEPHRVARASDPQ